MSRPTFWFRFVFPTTSTLLSALLLLFAIGCTRSSGNANPAGNGAQAEAKVSGSSASKALTRLVGEPVTEGEYFEAARDIEQAAMQGGETLGAWFDMEAVCDAALDDIEVGDKFKRDFKKGFLGASSHIVLGNQIADEVKRGGSYRLLHVHRNGAQHAAVFRLLNGAEGLNYHDLKLGKDAQGKIVVKDFYFLMTGEYMSRTVHRVALQGAAYDNRNLLQKLMKKDQEFIANIDKLTQLGQASKAGEHQRVLDLYDSMPLSMKEMKPMLIARLLAASELMNWDLYRATADDFRRVYPGDPAIDLQTLSLLIVDQKVDEALAAIDRIDKLIGGDHHLDVFRGAAFQEAGRGDEARLHYLQAIGHPQAVPEGYWRLLGMSLQAKEFDNTLKYLKEVESRFQIPIENLQSLPDYAEFVKSPQYQEWLKREK